MPGLFLTLIERDRLNKFPTDISNDDIITYFTLAPSDFDQIPIKSAEYNRLGFALQLCILRYLGYCPDNFDDDVPKTVINYLANQLNIDVNVLLEYGKRDHTRTDHFGKIMTYLGFRKPTQNDLHNLSNWLLERALEHDKPTLLFNMACEKLYSEKIVRPGVTIIEMMVTKVREKAHEETYKRLESIITNEKKDFMDKILVVDNKIGRTALFWLRRNAVSNTPKSILETIDKINFLYNAGVDNWDINVINPNRKKFLAQLGRKSTNQALQRMHPYKRYPILIAFLHQSLEDITDELVDLFDRCLSNCYARSKKDKEKYIIKVDVSKNEKLIVLDELLDIILNHDTATENIGDMIFERKPKSELQIVHTECKNLIRPIDDKYYDFLATRYSYIREFAKEFLETLRLKCNNNAETENLFEALTLLKKLNSEDKRKIPQEAPVKFIHPSWQHYIFNDKSKIVRKYYELCALWELRGALRAGNIWVENSRRYTDMENYLIPKDQWQSLRKEACRMLGLPEKGEIWLKQKQEKIEKALTKLDNKILNNEENIRIENNKLIVTRLKAEELSQNIQDLQNIITDRLPKVELTNLLIEVDGWTHFTDQFEHAGGKQPRSKDLLVHLYASILSQACNFGITKMSEISDISYDKLSWCSNWYLREETLQSAINTLVNYQYKQNLSSYWGEGTLSSSDGKRLPVPIKTRNATFLPKYFGYGKGLTFYSWTSDQFSQYGSKVIPATVRDATYVLDAILDNETELQIAEHTTDTLGYTEIVFALFDLMGMQFSPRIKDISDQRIYRLGRAVRYKKINPLLKGSIKENNILNNWDTILRVVASIKLGWVTSSLFINKLKSYPRKGALTKMLQEYGKIPKSIFIPNYLSDEDYQRRVNRQINKGESLNNLRGFINFVNDGKINKSQLEEQTNQAACLTLVTNAVIVWNTKYMQAIIDRLKEEGYPVNEEDLIHISPCRFEHINKYGKYSFNVDQELNRKELTQVRLIALKKA